MSANYTLTLGQITGTLDIFPSDYEFYNDNPIDKKKFENEFCDFYKFNEIGFETIGRFKHELKVQLNSIMPLYRQIYMTLEKAKEYDFMSNKDYKESYTRSNIGTNETDMDSKLLSNSHNSSTNSDISEDKAYSTPSTEIKDYTKYLTGISGNNSTSNNTSLDTSDVKNEVYTKADNTNTEKYEFSGKGNIGVTSTGQLLTDWQNTLRNLNLEIIEKLDILFMMIY